MQDAALDYCIRSSSIKTWPVFPLFRVYLHLSASGLCVELIRFDLKPLKGDWSTSGVLAAQTHSTMGKKRSCERSPVAATKPRTCRSRIIACIPRLRRDGSCGVPVWREAGSGDAKHTMSRSTPDLTEVPEAECDSSSLVWVCYQHLTCHAQSFYQTHDLSQACSPACCLFKWCC